MDYFHDIAAVEGWTESTQINVLLMYIENQQSDDVFKDFLNEKRFTSESVEIQPLGIHDALSLLNEDEELSLYEVEIGLFDLESDPNTPFETHKVVVAADNAHSALSQAQVFCEKNVRVIKSVAFSPCSEATLIGSEELEPYLST